MAGPEDGTAAVSFPGRFFGRDRELARVTGMLEEARAGRGRLVLCTGEAGIGKTRFAEKIWGRIAACWPDVRCIFLLRHPAAAVASLHASWDPAWRPEETGSLGESLGRGLRYMTVLERARQALPGLTVRYEDMTAGPETVGRRLCAYLGVPFEPPMLDYGRFAHAGFTPGLGDSSLSIRSGRIQPAAPLPGDIPSELTGICAAWGYLHPEDDPEGVQ